LPASSERKINEVHSGKRNTSQSGENTSQEQRTKAEHTEHRSKRTSKYDKSSREHKSEVRETYSNKQESINPEYAGGRHNPAAVNRKSQTGFYQKIAPAERHVRSPQSDTQHKRNRREDNGKPKQ
jgi:hypothetical protein